MKVKLFTDYTSHGKYFNEYKMYRFMIKINRTNLVSQKTYNCYNSAIKAGERFCKQNGWEICDV
ncbi:hypothetical protein VP14_030 [Vibrio phage VPMCC14]|nr:hypothetical protein VP14_030 [Vibrio phage VPMCC14]